MVQGFFPVVRDRWPSRRVSGRPARGIYPWWSGIFTPSLGHPETVWPR